MTENEAIKRIKKFGLYHATGDLPWSMLTVEAFEMAVNALEDIQQYRAVGTAGECRKAVERQKAVCRPEIFGQLSPLGAMSGTCRCGNTVSDFQHFCSECGVRLEWGNAGRENTGKEVS